MKKKYWMLGVAVAALTSCTQNEVLDIPEGKAIEFGTFVENATRAEEGGTQQVATSPKAYEAEDVTSSTISTFFVFGDYYTYNADKTTYTTPTVIFDNDEVSKNNGSWQYITDNLSTQYWGTGLTYRFAAYQNGINGGKIDNADYDSKNGSDNLTITDYDAKNQQKDLVAAIYGDVDTHEKYPSGAVQFTFEHMLAKVYFEFKLGAPLQNSNLKVSDVQIHNAITEDDLTYQYVVGDAQANIESWDNEYTEEITSYDRTGSYGPVTVNEALSSVIDEERYATFYVIPQSIEYKEQVDENTTAIKYAQLHFITNLYDNDGDLIENTDHSYHFSLSLDGIITENHWKPGYQYCYVVEFDATNDAKPIVFGVKNVVPWNDPIDGQSPEFDVDNDTEELTNNP